MSANARRWVRLAAFALSLAGAVALPAQLAGATTLGVPSGAGVATVSVAQTCSSACYGWDFGASMSGTLSLGGSLQVGSLQFVDIYTTVVSQTSTSVTFDLDSAGGFFGGSTVQGQSISGECGGTVTLTGAINSPTDPSGAVSAALSCTAALGGGPSAALTISIDGAEVGGQSQLGASGVLPLSGVGSYTTS
jgi:hypothetical protein